MEADYIPLLPCRDQISMLPPDVRAIMTFAAHSEAHLVSIHLFCCTVFLFSESIC